MKHFLFIVLYFSVFAFQAQTLTQSFNEPKVGDIHYTRTLDTSAYTTGLPKSTGANSNWNFSQLKADTFVFGTAYVAPSSTTLSAAYPAATVLEKQPGNIFMFMKSVTSPTTQTEVLGFASNQMSTTFTDPAVPIIYPVSMGSSHTDNIAGTYTFGTITGSCTGKVNTVADGTGTLTLPHGISYKNVLRVKSTQTITASLGTIKQTIIYFYDTSEKFPVLQLNYSAFTLAFGSPTVTGVARGDEDAFPVGILDYNLGDDEVLVYPNPAHSHLTVRSAIKSDELITAEIWNVLGQKVMNFTLNNSSAITIDVTLFDSGIYTITLHGKNVRGSKKLIIQ